MTIACTQEAPLFSEIAGEQGGADVAFANIRETAGWSSEGSKAGPKIAALLAAAAEPMPETALVSLTAKASSSIYGRDEQAIEAGRLLENRLDVTVLLTRPRDVAPPLVTEFPVVKGTIRSAKVASARSISWSTTTRRRLPSSRGRLAFGAARNGAVSRCDIILDLSGGPALFPAADLRDGYLRADPGDPGRAAARRAQGRRPRRHLRQAALHHVQRAPVRAFALAHRRLPPLPRSVPDRRDHARRQSCCDRRADLRRLRPVRRRLPDRRRVLCAAARRRAAAQAAHAAHHLPRGRRRAADRAAARPGPRHAADRRARASRRRPAGERAAAGRQRGDAGRVGSDRCRVRLRRHRFALPHCAHGRGTT